MAGSHTSEAPLDRPSVNYYLRAKASGKPKRKGFATLPAP
jgi:hypothetical protein